MNIPQFTLIVYLIVELILAAILNGKQIRIRFWSYALDVAILVIILITGEFFE